MRDASCFPSSPQALSWCHLKVIGGQQKTLVILTSEADNPGTFIANGATVLATQIVNLFDLEPETTIFLERTPPEDQHAEWRQWAAQEMPSHTPIAGFDALWHQRRQIRTNRFYLARVSGRQRTTLSCM